MRRDGGRARVVVPLGLIFLIAIGGISGSSFARIQLAPAQSATPYVGSSAASGDAPIPVEFPRDDGAHSAFIEWWYYTGHLYTDAGDRYGFEFVVFKGERSEDIVGYASHFAITDNPRGTFIYDERIAPVDPATILTTVSGTFDHRIGDWRMWGGGGDDRLVASMPGYAIALSLTQAKSPTLHDGDGYIDYGSGEASYYYSRTRLQVTGVLAVDGVTIPVTGEAWMDHQWGNFNTFDQGGWDWYSIQLSDGSDLMLYVITSEEGAQTVVDGSFVAPDGSLTVLDGDDFVVTPTGAWTSPDTAITYPSGWTITVPGEDLTLVVAPAMPDQELDTTATTGVIYWEGEVTVAGDRGGAPLSGLGYIELTGYGDRETTGD